MTRLMLGLTIFFAIHLLPSVPSARNALFARLGEKVYKGIYALISFIGLYFIVTGKGVAPFVALWEPPKWSYVITNVSMMVSLYLLVAMNMKSNIKRFTAHPMLWGVAFWAGGHLITNGDQASMMLFGSFLAYSLFAMYSANRRGATPGSGRVSFRYDAMVLVIAAVAYVLIANFHLWIAGVKLVR